MADESLDFDPLAFDKPIFPCSRKRGASGKSLFSSSSRQSSAAPATSRRQQFNSRSESRSYSTNNSRSTGSASSKPSHDSLSESSSSNHRSVSNSSSQSSSNISEPLRSSSVTSASRGSSTLPSQSQSSHDETITTVASSIRAVRPGVAFDETNSSCYTEKPSSAFTGLPSTKSTKSCNASISTERSNEDDCGAFSSQDSSQLSRASDSCSNTRSNESSNNTRGTFGLSKSTVTKGGRNAIKQYRNSQRSNRSEWLNDGVAPQDGTGKGERYTPALTNSRNPATLRLDVSATTDAGNSQFFRDEVIWCCSNVVGNDKAEKTQAAMDLALLVADKMKSPSHASAEAFLHDDVATALVEVISFCKTLHNSSTLVSDEETTSRADQDETAQLTRFLVTTLHFLAVACCDLGSRRHASNGSQRNLSHVFLSSPDSMLGIMCLVLADPRLSIVLGRRRPLHSHLGFDHCPISGNDPSTPSSQSTVSSTASPGSMRTSADGTASSMISCSDPTRMGRFNRNKRRRIVFDSCDALSPIQEDVNGADPEKKAARGSMDYTDDLSFSVEAGQDQQTNSDHLAFGSQTSRLSSSAHKDLLSTLRRVSKSTGVPCDAHSCGHDQDVWLEDLPLLALNRIITRKLDGCTHSTQSTDNAEVSTFGAPMDYQVVEHDHDFDDKDDGGDNGDDGRSDKDKDNPILACNVQLGASGAIPLLAAALAETLLAVSRLLSRTCRRRSRQQTACRGCLSHLLGRVRTLVSIIDGASLFCVSNRVKFCQAGYTVDLGGYLIVGLATVLSRFLDAEMLFESTWGEFVLEILRTLTSLTHENKLAAKELEAQIQASDRCCLDVLGEVLYLAVTPVDSLRCSDDKQKYDCSILCMNIFTNYLESGGSRERMETLHLLEAPNHVKIDFLPWFTRWVVSETSSFRDALMDISMGTSPSKHAKRTLQEKEDEKLVAAGNGFILLACLMLNQVGGESSPGGGSALDRIRATVAEYLPGSDFPTKLTFVKNALKVFCNFYHASVGDLSLAIVDPVNGLIQQLDAMSRTNGLKDHR